MAFKLKCPECREKFPWEPLKPWPRFCPMCRADINNDRADDDVVMPFIRHSSTKKNDALYRQMEAASEHRMHAAAEMAGCDVSEMSSLKMTNMNDRNDTPIAEVMIPPDSGVVGQAMLQNPNLGFGAGNNPGTSLGVGGGKSDVLLPAKGMSTHDIIKQGHPQSAIHHIPQAVSR